MLRTLLTILLLLCVTSAFGQTQQQQRNRSPNGAYCCAVATHPSNNPFSNPIGQGVPPAASAQPYWNGQAAPAQRRR